MSVSTFKTTVILYIFGYFYTKRNSFKAKLVRKGRKVNNTLKQVYICFKKKL